MLSVPFKTTDVRNEKAVFAWPVVTSPQLTRHSIIIHTSGHQRLPWDWQRPIDGPDIVTLYTTFNFNHATLLPQLSVEWSTDRSKWRRFWRRVCRVNGMTLDDNDDDVDIFLCVFLYYVLPLA